MIFNGSLTFKREHWCPGASKRRRGSADPQLIKTILCGENLLRNKMNIRSGGKRNLKGGKRGKKVLKL